MYPENKKRASFHHNHVSWSLFMFKELAKCFDFTEEMGKNPVVNSSVIDEDEVGDRITVRSDEELKAMLSYVSTVSVFCYQIYWEILFGQSAISFKILNNLSCQVNNLRHYHRSSWIRQYVLDTSRDFRFLVTSCRRYGEGRWNNDYNFGRTNQNGLGLSGLCLLDSIWNW